MGSLCTAVPPLTSVFTLTCSLPRHLPYRVSGNGCFTESRAEDLSSILPNECKNSPMGMPLIEREMLDLINKRTGHAVTFEFQITNK